MLFNAGQIVFANNTVSLFYVCIGYIEFHRHCLDCCIVCLGYFIPVDIIPLFVTTIQYGAGMWAGLLGTASTSVITVERQV